MPNLYVVTPVDAKTFVSEQVKAIKAVLADKRPLVATSGGVDSTTCAVLTLRAVGDNLLCVLIDDNFRRIGEPGSVTRMLSSLGLPVRLVDAGGEFMRRLSGIEDAEDKRRAYREAFYRTLARVAKEEGCEYLVQGTIAADWVETKGGIKTQHNVLEQIGINPVERYGFRVIEPLVNLYKSQVRGIARYLGVPVAEKQPFPGPGLAIRVIGRITQEKLGILRRATAIVEEELAGRRPSQYFAAIIDDEVIDGPADRSMRRLASASLGLPTQSVKVETLKARATGIREGKRAYGRMALLSMAPAPRPSVSDLVKLQERLLSENPEYTRLLVEVERSEGRYIIAIRAVETMDFLTAKVTAIPWETLWTTAFRTLRECNKVSRVCYDVTPKPPATIEFE